MKNSILIPLLCLFFSGSLMAQREETLFGRNGFGLTGAWGAATYNYSFFDEDYVYNRGGNFGLEFGNNFFVGYGWSRFKEQANPEGLRNFRMRYNGVVLGISPNASKAIHPRLAMLLGGGKVFLEDGDDDQVFVFQPSAGLEINVFQWFRLGLEGGYRLVGNENIAGLTAEDISAPFAQIDLRFGFTWDR